MVRALQKLTLDTALMNSLILIYGTINKSIVLIHSGPPQNYMWDRAVQLATLTKHHGRMTGTWFPGECGAASQEKHLGVT